MLGNANFDIRNVPFRLISICRSHSSSLHSSSGLRIENTGIVEQDVELAEGVQRFVHGATALGGLADIGANENGLAAALQDLVSDRVSSLLVPAGNGEIGAFFGKKDRGCLADARGSTGDEGDFVL